MQLTEEEARIIAEFRHKTAVLRAFNEGLDTALACVETARQWPNEDLKFSEPLHLLNCLAEAIQEQAKPIRSEA